MPDAGFVVDSLRFYLAALPWYLPGVAASLVIGVLTSGPVARFLRTSRAIAYFLIVSSGAILAATIPPGVGGFDQAGDGSMTCHFHRVWLADPHDYVWVSETTLNVLLFLPLGMAIALLPLSARTLALALAATLLPTLVELAQFAVPRLDRACESADVVDNLFGLLLGCGAGLIGRAIARVTRAMRPGYGDERA